MSRRRPVPERERERRSENQRLWLKILFKLNDYTLDEVETLCLRYKKKRAENKERRERATRELRLEDEERKRIWKNKQRKIKENRRKREMSQMKNTVVLMFTSVLLLLTQGCIVVPITTEIVKHGVKNVITTGDLLKNAIKISRGEPSFKEERHEDDTVFVSWHIKVRVEAPCRCNVDTTAMFFDHDGKKVETDTASTEFSPGDEKDIRGVVKMSVTEYLKIRELRVNVEARNIVKK